MTARPTGTVTFLFTDVVGSTQLWEEHPDAMREALARHDAIVRSVVDQHDGYVFSTAGDAFCVAFAVPVAAIDTALALHRSLAAEPWPQETQIGVRAGVHTGAADERDGDYYGQPLNRAARIMGLADRGEILVSTATAELVRSIEARGIGIVDLGEHTLRGVGPARVHGIVPPTGPAPAFVKLRTPEGTSESRSKRGRLPERLSSFVGRDEQLAQLTEAVAASRLVTLVGPGGMGKTSLSIRLAGAVADRYLGEVALVELASISDADALDAAVVRAIGLEAQPGVTPRELLVNALATRRSLLVFDNCEHLLDAVAALVEHLLSGCPELAVLATSRAALRVAGENVQHVGPLRLADEAPSLFEARARSARPGFTLTEDTRPTVHAICSALDGMPLAIELAAARLRSLSPAELLDRLDQRFRLLRASRPGAAGRHDGLQELVSWSYEMLRPPAQELFRDLGVFAGAFDLDAAHAVCRPEAGDELDTLDLLDHLAEHSLVRVRETSHGTRFEMLETLRLFALQQCEQAGRLEQLRDAHAAYFSQLAASADRELAGRDQVRWLDRLDIEHDNFRAALQHALSPHGNPALGLELAGSLAWFWRVRNHLDEGPRWLDQALAGAAADAEPATRIRALTGRGLLRFFLSHFDDATEDLRAAHELAVSTGHDALAGWALHGLGRIATFTQDATATELFAASIAACTTGADPRGVAYSEFFLASVQAGSGDLDRADELFERSFTHLDEIGDLWGLTTLLNFWSQVPLRQGRIGAAAARQLQAVLNANELGSPLVTARALLALAATAHRAGEFSLLVQLHSAAEALCEPVGATATFYEPHFQRRLADARNHLGDDAYDVNWHLGATANPDAAADLGRRSAAVLNATPDLPSEHPNRNQSSRRDPKRADAGRSTFPPLPR